jgi:hypothetical protein
MVNDAFQCADDPTQLEDRLREEVLHAFIATDDLHEEYNEGQSSDGDDDAVRVQMEEEAGDTNTMPPEVDSNFDADTLEEALSQLYSGAWSTKLAATILLMNLCTVHGISNSFADELFAILHAHLLPERNGLPKNYHAAKSLIRKLGLSYNSIHACEKGCICTVPR